MLKIWLKREIEKGASEDNFKMRVTWYSIHYISVLLLDVWVADWLAVFYCRSIISSLHRIWKQHKPFIHPTLRWTDIMGIEGKERIIKDTQDIYEQWWCWWGYKFRKYCYNLNQHGLVWLGSETHSSTTHMSRRRENYIV